MSAIPLVASDELLHICSRISDNKAAGLNGILNRAVQLAVKHKPNMTTACISEEFFPVIWEQQKLVMLPKNCKLPDEPCSHRYVHLLNTGENGDNWCFHLSHCYCEQLIARTDAMV